MHLASFRFFDAYGNVDVIKVAVIFVQLLIVNMPKTKSANSHKKIVLSLRVDKVALHCPSDYSSVL